MLEADRLTNCPYCDVQNYMVGGSMLRFVLPDNIPEHIHREDIIYFPYLRFKGNIYTIVGKRVGYKVLDTTHQGLDVRLLPPSLGLRPQAMKIYLVNEKSEGKFIKRRETPASVLRRAEKLARAVIDIDETPLYHRAFIGETVSCLYLPLYIDHDTVYDGILNREIGETEDWLVAPEAISTADNRWQQKFLAMICPRCGDTMQGDSDSIVVHCYNCHSCWTEEQSSFKPVDYQLIPGRKRRMVYLPFWRIIVESTGVEMQTLADLLKATNQPVVIRKKHVDQQLEFWIPAIKIRPKVFLTLAKTATLSQLKYPEGEQRLKKPLHPVTLPLKEAVQSITSVFAETTVSRQDVMPLLPKLSFTVKKSVLSFLPFEDTGHDYVQVHSGFSVASSVVRFGRRL